MKLTATLSALLSLAAVSASRVHDNHEHAHWKRQDPTQSPGSPPPAATGTQSGAATTTNTGAPAPSASLDATQSIPLSQLTSGMPVRGTLDATTTYQASATPPVSGAPVLPTPFQFVATEWPAQDKVPPTDSDELKEWMKELDGWDIPDLSITVEDAMCDSNPEAKAKAEERGWWTCAPGLTRDTDITSCPEKMTWGVSFDDGPSPYTRTVLKYLDEKDIKATFFVVGSRVISRPDILTETYMAGHEISVHTWSHHHLTTLTTEQVVAELGWSRKAIQKVLGVTPTTMRPPFGDMDDRVRNIAMAMGLIPILWTRTPSGAQMDTNDWRVAGGLVTGAQSVETFNDILGNASTMDTGFIVLQHDLFQVTVDLAVHFTLDTALTHNPPFTLKPIGQCANIPTSNLYRESNTNTSFPITEGEDDGSIDVDGDGNADTPATGNGESAPDAGNEDAAASLGTSQFAILGLSIASLLGSLLM